MLIPTPLYTNFREVNSKTLLLGSLLYNHVLKIDANNIALIAIDLSEACRYLRARSGSVLYCFRKLQKIGLIKVLNISDRYVQVEWLGDIKEIIIKENINDCEYDYEDENM